MTHFDIDKNHIVIVDDNPQSLATLKRILINQGYQVHPAISGEIALTLISKTLPDLILLDILMPGMDGYEVCQRLKADENTRNVPVIFISALGETMDKIKAFNVGGIDYVTKPFQIEEIVVRVKTHLTIRNLQKELEEANCELEHQIQEQRHLNSELQTALDNVKLLSGLLPICAECKKIRNDEGYWQRLEAYIETHSEVRFSHGLCPDCVKKLYQQLYQDNQK
jgi:DNA-binding response OmpR family regulator